MVWMVPWMSWGRATDEEVGVLIYLVVGLDENFAMF
jgi:hypothetical protein